MYLMHRRLQPNFPDYLPRFHAPWASDCLASLVSWSGACSSKAAAMALAFLIISSASSGGNTTLSAGRYARFLICPWHRQVVRYPKLQ